MLLPALPVLLLIAAAVCWAIGALQVAPRINWLCAGLCCAMLGVLAGAHVIV